MNFLEKLTTFFSPQKKAVENTIIQEELPALLQNDSLPPATNTSFVTLQEVAETTDEPLPHWLSSEDALRDEGVIFGLSTAEAEEKIAVIRTFFIHQTADLEKEVEHLSEKIGELNLFIEQRENKKKTLLEKMENLTQQTPKEHNLLRTAVGLLLSVGMCVGNFYLIDTSLSVNFPTNHAPIAFGILLAGMFNLFGKLSFFHEKNTSISWRQIAEEIGMPLAAAFFVFVQTIDNQTIIRSISLFGFVFFLFLFAGKLFLSNLSILKTELGLVSKNRKLQRDKKELIEKWETESQELEKEIDEFRIQKWQILPNLNKAEASLARYNSKRDSLIKLFESEFRLARSYRDRLSGKQIKTIVE
jgi:hypothetical protein